ncbi:MAG: endolytic transglycosylase MltG [Eubacteriales bacterium]|nr:endolytic transglycosylase MltG [Eubacteriales bacterium]
MAKRERTPFFAQKGAEERNYGVNDRPRLLTQGVWEVLRKIIMVVCACMILISGGLFAWKYVDEHYLLPADSQDHTPIRVTIKRGTSISGIASQLEEGGIIRSATAFKLYLDLGGHASKVKAGTYYLNKTMTMQEITEKMVKGDGGTQVTSFLIPEGTNVEQMAASLVEQGVLESPDAFLELCRTGKGLTADYDFIKAVANNPGDGRKYVLEGYLFPARYEIYVGSSEETIIRKMLNKFANVMNEDFVKRAGELDLSVDQVVALASLIEKEGKTSNFSKVSAVFHLRLKKGITLASDPSILYFTGKKTTSEITADDLATDSPYNIYKNKGLPVSAVSNPGLNALKAALYPDEKTMDAGYLYFILKDPETGELEFNKTLAEHNAAREKYAPLWQAYEEKLAAQKAAQEQQDGQ